MGAPPAARPASAAELRRATRALWTSPAQHQPLDLSDREQVRTLISRSPQLDNLSEAVAGNDATRCGGAALLNGMLLDGNFRANANAVDAALRSRQGGQLTSDERTAIAGFRGGQLTPRDAAVLQDSLYRAAGGSATGVSPPEMSRLVSELHRRGAFPDSNVTLRDTPEGNGAHWTVSSESRVGLGTAHADSWPNLGSGPGAGFATVESGPGPVGFRQPNFGAEISLSSRAARGGTPARDELQVRWLATHSRGDRVIEETYTANRGHDFSSAASTDRADPRTAGRQFYDPATGQPATPPQEAGQAVVSWTRFVLD